MRSLFILAIILCVAGCKATNPGCPNATPEMKPKCPDGCEPAQYSDMTSTWWECDPIDGNMVADCPVCAE